MLFFYLLYNALDEPGMVESSLSLILLSSVIYGLYGVLQVFHLDVIHWTSFGAENIYSTLSNPDEYAGQIALVLPLAMAFLFLGIRRVWFGLLALILGTALFFTRSKAGLLATVIALGFFGVGLWLEGRKIVLNFRKVAALVLLLGVILIVVLYGCLHLFSAGLPQPFSSLLTLDQGSLGIRFFMWQSALDLIKDGWFLGHGPGSFRILSPMAQSHVWQAKFGAGVLTPFMDVHDEAYAHNDFLQMASEGGLVALGFFLWFVAVLFRIGFRFMKREIQPVRRITVLALLSGWVAYLVFSFFHFPLQMPSLAVTAFAYAAFVACFDRIYGSEGTQAASDAGLSRGLRRILEAAGVLIVLFALFFVIRGFIGGLECKAGLEARRDMKYQEAQILFEKAIKNEPQEASLYFYDALCLEATGNLAEAGTAYKKALDRYPYFSGAWYNLANVYQRQGRLKEAEESFRNSLKIKPNNHEAFNNLGNLYYGIGSRLAGDPSYKLQATKYFRQAQVQYEKALLFKPGFADAHYNLGVIYFVLGEFKSAQQEWEQTLILHPQHDQALNMLERVKKKTKSRR